jgi:hypothetical protein
MFSFFSTTDPQSTHNRDPYAFTQASRGSARISQRAYLTQPIYPSQPGRLHYLATEWNAIALDGGSIPIGTAVQPVQRRGNTWLVAVAQEAALPVA